MSDGYLPFVVGLFLGALIAWGGTTSDWKARCVKQGVAHWVVDDNGTTTFEWNEPEPTP